VGSLLIFDESGGVLKGDACAAPDFLDTE